MVVASALQLHLLTPEPSFRIMVGIIRYIRHIRRSGLGQWWRNMQYIGDAKYGALQGTDQSVSPLSSVASRMASSDRSCTGLGLETGTLRTLTLRTRCQVSRRRIVDSARRCLRLHLILCRPPPMGRLCSGTVARLPMAIPKWLAQYVWFFTQHEYHASQVPPEWHAWLQHIRKDPPTEDPVMQNLSPAWKSVRNTILSLLPRVLVSP